MRRLAVITLVVAVPYTAAGLWADRYVDHTGQLLLGVLTAAVLAALLPLQSRAARLQTLAVVGIATVGEVIGSLVWGLYTYRLENIPAFVPPGHGLVFLCGLSLATLVGRRPTPLLAAAIAGAAIWGIAGLTVLPARDTAGAIGCAFLIAVLLRTRRPVYAGVFSSLPRSSSTGPRSEPGRGRESCPDSASRRETRRVASPQAMSSSTSSPSGFYGAGSGQESGFSPLGFRARTA